MSKKEVKKEVVFENEKYVFFIRVKDNERFEMVKKESEDIYFLIENLEFFRVDYLFGKEWEKWEK